MRAPETFHVTTTVPPSSTVAASVWPSGENTGCANAEAV